MQMIRTTSSRPYVAAVVTDLHLGDPQAASRMASFTGRLASLRGRANALFMSGDTFSISSKEHWAILMDGRASQTGIEDLREYSHSLVESYMPRILDAAKAADIEDIYMIPGNGDSIGYHYLSQNTARFPVKAADKRFIHANGETPVNIAGLGGIEPDGAEAQKIEMNNPWYKGVMSGWEYNLHLRSLGISFSNSTGTSLLMTHMPAFGHLDLFSGYPSTGSKVLLDFITRYKPLVHLCGHVHTGAYIGDDYIYKPFSVIGGHTVSINPGGGNNHDYEEGVLMVTLDMNALKEGLAQGDLEAAAANSVIPVE